MAIISSLTCIISNIFVNPTSTLSNNLVISAINENILEEKNQSTETIIVEKSNIAPTKLKKNKFSSTEEKDEVIKKLIIEIYKFQTYLKKIKKSDINSNNIAKIQLSIETRIKTLKEKVKNLKTLNAKINYLEQKLTVKDIAKKINDATNTENIEKNIQTTKNNITKKLQELESNTLKYKNSKIKKKYLKQQLEQNILKISKNKDIKNIKSENIKRIKTRWQKQLQGLENNIEINKNSKNKINYLKQQLKKIISENKFKGSVENIKLENTKKIKASIDKKLKELSNITKKNENEKKFITRTLFTISSLEKKAIKFTTKK